MVSRSDASDIYSLPSSRVSSGSQFDGCSHLSNNSISETPAAAHQQMGKFLASVTDGTGQETQSYAQITRRRLAQTN